jgi:GNAT superfamily N-acetyltransferase
MQPRTLSTPLPAIDSLASFPPVCGALAEALKDDVFYQAVTIDRACDPALRHCVLARYFALALAEARAVGEAHLAGDDGAALWLTPEAPARQRALHSERRTQALSRLLGPAGFCNYQRMGTVMEAQVPADLQGAWYLSILGVRPAAQGQGLAQRLLQPTLARADQVRATCYLETFNPLSLPFYRRIGFVRVVERVEPVSGSPYWLMAREAAQLQP